jgi:hypothetical protein
LVYFGARYLAPALGRWISADPATIHVLEADPNAYAYVSGQLLKNVDPLGLEGAIPVQFVPESVRAEAKAAGVEIKADGKFAFEHKPSGQVLVYAPNHPNALSPKQWQQYLAILSTGTPNQGEEAKGGNTLGGDLGVIAAFANLETPDAIPENGERLGAVGGGCTGPNCIRSEAAQVGIAAAQLISAIVGMAKSVAQGIVKGTRAGTERILEAAGKRVDAARDEAVRVAREFGDRIQNTKPRGSMGGAIVTPDGKPFTDMSGGGRPLHPEVEEFMDSLPESQRSPTHKKCFEPHCISQMLNQGVDPRGSTSAATKVRPPGNAKHGEVTAPCKSCAPLLEHFGVDGVK